MSLRAMLVLTAIASLMPLPTPAAEGVDAKIAPWLISHLDEGPMELLVLLRGEARASDPAGGAALYAALTSRAQAGQRDLLDFLASEGVEARPFYLVNAVLIRADLALARRIAARADVLRLVGNPRIRALQPAAQEMPEEPGVDGVEWGVEMVHAPAIWNDYDAHGEGMVVASQDTGVDWEHPAIHEQYRGWDGSTVDHSYSWHDAIEDSAVAWDDHGHGTHTVGTMVGDDGAGNQVGVAPKARWIACRNMDHGVGTPASYLDCMEWLLAPYPPGGDSFTDGRPEMAPDIVNNSWGCPPSEGCDTEVLTEAIVALRRAGIWMIAAAGNDGPNCNTIKDPPAIYAEVFTVGAVTSSRALTWFSSRGPVTVDGSSRRKPNLSAPGDGVRSCVPGGGYSVFSGTSMASPHVAGSAALLWSAIPQLAGLIDITECVFEQSAYTPVGSLFSQSCGGISHKTYPNNIAGFGIVDNQAAAALPEGDGDAVADACDCAPADAGTFAAPRRVTGLRFTTHEQLEWDDQSATSGNGIAYDTIRGLVSDLRADGDISRAECLAAGLGGNSQSDGARPEMGAAFYYLLRARNSCGTTDYTDRASTACDS